ncbi:hypothetical protein VTO73DRAFT_14751 [Trametes versicolor]
MGADRCQHNEGRQRRRRAAEPLSAARPGLTSLSGPPFSVISTHDTYPTPTDTFIPPAPATFIDTRRICVQAHEHPPSFPRFLV